MEVEMAWEWDFNNHSFFTICVQQIISFLDIQVHFMNSTYSHLEEWETSVPPQTKVYYQLCVEYKASSQTACRPNMTADQLLVGGIRNVLVAVLQ